MPARTVLALLLLFAGPVRALEWPAACERAARRMLPTWQPIVAPPEAAAWARRQRADPALARGDFDADGRRDWAGLGTVGGQAWFVFCLDRAGGRPVTRMLVWNGCRDVIVASRRGTIVHDFDAGRAHRLPRDGVGAYCFEKAGQMVLVDARGRFRVFTHGD